MKIIDVHFVASNSAFYFDCQKAIKNHAESNGFVYNGHALTGGFHSIRQPGEAVSILLRLENGHVAKGDCVAVQYSGAGGRDPLFTAQAFIPFMEEHIRPKLIGLNVSEFLAHSRYFDELFIDGKNIHTAIRYGISQALLDASAIANGCLKCEVLCKEYHLPIKVNLLPIFGQSGDDRYTAVDKMILKGVDSLPHGLINNVADKLGRQGEKLVAYVKWLRTRVFELRASADYKPDIHIDVYGTIGQIFNYNPVAIANYINELQYHIAPLNLYIEGPIDCGSRDSQIEAMKEIKDCLEKINSNAKIVADEWCNTYSDILAFADAGCCHMIQVKTPDLGGIHNTLEAILYCEEKGVESYQGGSCNETDISAQSCVHVALAARPKRLLAKPGMGFDEGFVIVKNEMLRSVQLLKSISSNRVRVNSKQAS